MIEEMIGGPASNIASHCAPKSGGLTSPASRGTSGPQLCQEVPYGILGSHIALGKSIGNPEIELKSAVAAGAHVRRPRFDRLGLHQECTTAPQPAGIGNGNSQRRRASAGHRSHQDWHAEIERLTKRSGTNEGWMIRHDAPLSLTQNGRFGRADLGKPAMDQRRRFRKLAKQWGRKRRIHEYAPPRARSGEPVLGTGFWVAWGGAWMNAGSPGAFPRLLASTGRLS